MKLTKLLLVLASFGALVVASDSGALAASPQRTTFDVTASVIPNCHISALGIDFGPYDPLLGTDTTQTGTVTITCTKGANVSIGLSGGGSPAAPFNQMVSATAPGSVLQYKLFQDASHTTQWNDSQSATGAPGGSGVIKTITVGTMEAVPYTIYGLVPAGQPASVATDYTDTVTATVNF